MFIICLGLFQLSSIGQVVDTTSHATELGFQYAERSKNENAVAYTLLSAGLLCVFIAAQAMGTLFTKTTYDQASSTATVGFGMVLASVPVFIIAGKNKRKSVSYFHKKKSF